MQNLASVHDFSQNNYTDIRVNELELLGYQGSNIMNLARLSLPIAPGFILDSCLTKNILNGFNIKSLLKEKVKNIEKLTSKLYGDSTNPLFLIVSQSSDTNFIELKSIYHIGINSKTVIPLAAETSDEFAYEVYRDFYKNVGMQLLNIPESEFDNMGGRLTNSRKIEDVKSVVDLYYGLVEDSISLELHELLETIIKQSIKHFYSSKENSKDNLSIVVQAMVYGNYSGDSFVGSYITRDNLGKSKIQGKFYKKKFHNNIGEGEDIQTLSPKYLAELKSFSSVIEKHFKDIREIHFTIEKGKLWVTYQNKYNGTSIQAYLKTLLDLKKQDIISDSYLLQAISCTDIDDLLFPVIDPTITKNIDKIKGGIAGSPGITIGRICFSTENLINEYHNSLKNGELPQFILCLKSITAEDINAIDLSCGIISTEGDFLSYTSVVSRSLKKINLINSKIKINNNSFTNGKRTIKEGDWLTLDVSYHREPVIYLDKVPLIKPDIRKNGLNELLDLMDKHVGKMEIIANADQERDVILAKQFGHLGMVLYKTEHMFFEESRIMLFRKMIISTDLKDRIDILDKLLPLQESDFYQLFKCLEGLPIAIRLLSIPLYDFLPHSTKTMQEFIAYVTKDLPNLSDTDIIALCENARQSNPIIGNRGSRLFFSYPEIFYSQIKAIFRAYARIVKEGKNDVNLQIIVPMTINKNELLIIKNGKHFANIDFKGIEDISNEISKEFEVPKLAYTLGSTIELPTSALQAGNLAQHAQIIMFDSDNLTQTIVGLSKNDLNTFQSYYKNYDIFSDEHFNVLSNDVKELINIAFIRAKMTRPDIKIGFLGNHVSEPINIKFCHELGLNYISCSPYQIPNIKLTIAKLNLAKNNSSKE